MTALELQAIPEHVNERQNLRPQFRASSLRINVHELTTIIPGDKGLRFGSKIHRIDGDRVQLEDYSVAKALIFSASANGVRRFAISNEDRILKDYVLEAGGNESGYALELHKAWRNKLNSLFGPPSWSARINSLGRTIEGEYKAAYGGEAPGVYEGWTWLPSGDANPTTRIQLRYTTREPHKPYVLMKVGQPVYEDDLADWKTEMQASE